jgi:hypothetical protein
MADPNWAGLSDDQIAMAFLMGEGGNGNAQQYATILDSANNRVNDPWFRRTYGDTLRSQLLAKQPWGGNRAEYDAFSSGLAGPRSAQVYDQVVKGSFDPSALSAAERRQWDTAKAALEAYRRGEGQGSARGATFYATPQTGAAGRVPQQNDAMAFNDGQHLFWKMQDQRYQPLLPSAGPAPAAKPWEYGGSSGLPTPTESDFGNYAKIFNPAYYLESNKDVAAAGANPWQHFKSSGYKEGRRANPFFDQSYYENASPDVKAAGIDPLTHFMNGGWKEGRSASAAFNPSDYMAANPDVQAAGVNPLMHFLQSGIGEHRSGANFETMQGLNPSDPWAGISGMGVPVDGPWAHPAPTANLGMGLPPTPSPFTVDPFSVTSPPPIDTSWMGNPNPAAGPSDLSGGFNPAAGPSALAPMFQPTYPSVFVGPGGFGGSPAPAPAPSFGGYPVGGPYGGAFGGGGPGPMVITVNPSAGASDFSGYQSGF